MAADAKEASHAQDAVAEPRIKRTVASLNMLLGVEDDPVEGTAEAQKPDAVSLPAEARYKDWDAPLC